MKDRRDATRPTKRRTAEARRDVRRREGTEMENERLTSLPIPSRLRSVSPPSGGSSVSPLTTFRSTFGSASETE